MLLLLLPMMRAPPRGLLPLQPLVAFVPAVLGLGQESYMAQRAPSCCSLVCFRSDLIQNRCLGICLACFNWIPKGPSRRGIPAEARQSQLKIVITRLS